MANKLELTWYGKDQPIVVEPRLLIENAKLSHCAGANGNGELFNNDSATTDNLLIHGDNLLALKALEAKFAGQVKCIYIDPPYNTGSAFEHYDDNLEHSQWLNLMRPRLEILRNLLADDGSIWISIDDDEQAYLKVLCDEVFGRNNFITAVIWQKIHSLKNDAKYLSVNHDFILLYAKDKENIKFCLLARTAEMNGRYTNPDGDPRGPWQSGDLVANEERTNGYYEITSPKTGKIFNVPKGKHWVYAKENLIEMIRDNRVWFGVNGDAFPRKKRFLSEVSQGRKCDTIWKHDDVGHNQEAKREIIKLFGKQTPFATPKPERLLERVITLASNPGDLVLDSFLGSGTTAAVAHKMGRRWIGIEMGEHAYTHCKVRLDKVIDGADAGGITKSAKWKGGGGYRFYELAPTLINIDPFGEAVINTDYSPDMLAAAMALHEGFTYQPDAENFWKQAVGNEKSYLFTTTKHLTAAYMDSIRSTMAEGEYLVIACRSFDAGLDKASDHITIKKIPQMLLSRCEFGKADYALNIVHPPVLEDEEETEADHE